MTASRQDYSVIISEITLKKAEEYKRKLESDPSFAGRFLKDVLEGQSLKEISTAVFIDYLIKTKRPKFFAESEIKGDGRDWNQSELSILGDINMAVPVTVFDDGTWTNPHKHDKPFDATLLFTPGALLKTGQDGKSADMGELIKPDGTIDSAAYIRLYERRLLPLLINANQNAGKDGAFITIPGVGCGEFAGKFKGQLGPLFQLALENILTKHGHNLPNVKAIYYDPFGECQNQTRKINGVDLLVRPQQKLADKDKKTQLCHPAEYENGKYGSCKLFSVVAWDHVSWPGNDFYAGSRSTDDGVKAAATNSMQVMTGLKGTYDPKDNMYQPPAKGKTWGEVIKEKGITLETKDKIHVLPEHGSQLMKLQEGSKSPTVSPPSITVQNKSTPLNMVSEEEASLAAKNLTNKTGMNWKVEGNKNNGFSLSINEIQEEGYFRKKLKESGIEYKAKDSYGSQRGLMDQPGKVHMQAYFDNPLEIQAMSRNEFKPPKISEQQLSQAAEKLSKITGFTWLASDNEIILRQQIHASDSDEAVEIFREKLRSLGISNLPEIEATTRGLKGTGLAEVTAVFKKPLEIQALNTSGQSKLNEYKPDTQQSQMKQEESRIYLYKAKNGELAVKFPDEPTAKAFLAKLGGEGRKFSADDKFNAGKLCPAQYSDNPTTLYFPAYIAKNGEFAGAFSSQEMKKTFYDLLIKDHAAIPAIIDNNSKAIYFSDTESFKAGKSVSISVPDELKPTSSHIPKR